MNTRFAVVVAAPLLLLLTARPGAAADPEAVAQKVTLLNRAAVAAYSDGDFDKMKVKLLEAVALGKDALAIHPMLARTYLHLGVLWVDGYENRAKGIAYFVKALKINPTIEITTGMATKTVVSAFAEAHGDAPPAAAAEPEGGAPTATTTKKKTGVARAKEEPAAEEGEDDRRAGKADAAEKRRAEAAEKESERTRGEKEKLQADLAQAKEDASKERAEKERLQRDMKQLVAEAKQQLLQADGESKKETQQAEAEHKKELQQAEAESKKELAQAEKEKADKDKQIADGNLREKKERDAKEKLEKDKAAADTKEKERKAAADSERADREKLAAGPELPAHLSEPLSCAVPEEAPAGADLYVHCVARPSLKAKTIAFFYRPSGVAIYNVIVMDPSKHGWFTALLPASKVTGRSLQYYAEARDAHQVIAAATGKATSPNILTLRSTARK